MGNSRIPKVGKIKLPKAPGSRREPVKVPKGPRHLPTPGQHKLDGMGRSALGKPAPHKPPKLNP